MRIKDKIKITPILILSIIFILIAIPSSIFYLTVETGGGMALAGTIFFIGFLITLLIVFIEQIIVKNINYDSLKIWVIELIIVAGIVLLYSYSNKEIKYSIDDNADWFVTIDSNENYTTPEYSFPFNVKYYLTNNQILFINSSKLTEYKKLMFLGEDITK